MAVSITWSIDKHLLGPLMAESEEELKRFLMKVKKESERDSLKLNIKS